MTEIELIKGCQEEQAEYQRELVLRYSPMLLTVARRYARDRNAAQDILQEALIKILRAMPRYRPTGSFEAWMRRIIVTSALQSFDKRCFKNEVYGLEHLPENGLAPEVYGRLGAEELMKLIEALPDGFRQVFNLSVIEGYSHREIGELLNITESTSRSQLTRARQLIQKQILNQKKIGV